MQAALRSAREDDAALRPHLTSRVANTIVEALGEQPATPAAAGRTPRWAAENILLCFKYR